MNEITLKSGKITLLSPSFTWACGIEDTFIPQARPGLRALDEYALTQHYEQWRTDFDLVAESGVQALRWGIPWYRVQPEARRWEWGWVDEVLDYLVNVKGITPILDLMHYGTPVWLDNSFINASYPERVAEYAARVAERYQSLVRHYTPLNEPMVNAEFCGQRGEWPPYLTGEDGRTKLTLALARGIVETVRALKAVQPDCVTVQVEALWRNWTQDPALSAEVSLNNARQYLSYDLCTGQVGEDHPLWTSLCQQGMKEADFRWFAEHATCFDIFGANFYPWSYGEVALGRDGKPRRLKAPTSGLAIGEVLREAAEHTGLPVMVTETSAKDTVEGRARWMVETVTAVRRLRQEGVRVIGYTWFPLFTMLDWAYRTGRKPIQDYLLHLGLYEARYNAAGVLERYPTSLVAQYRQIQAEPMPDIQSA